MQSSGVGNCINMLSLRPNGRFPLLMLVTMRGEWAEFNPWQVPMGLKTPPALESIGLMVYRVEHTEEERRPSPRRSISPTTAISQSRCVLSQRLIGVKKVGKMIAQ